MSDLEVWTERYKAGNTENIDVLFINGRSEALNFLDVLYKEDRDAWDKFDYVFERKCDGFLRDSKRFHSIQGKGAKGSYEFKARGRGKTWRIYCFRKGDSWVLTHGGEKPKDKKVLEEGKKCVDRKKLLREAGRNQIMKPQGGT